MCQYFRQKINGEEKVTIIQVTHSEKNAEYGHRIIHLLDGRIESVLQKPVNYRECKNRNYLVEQIQTETDPANKKKKTVIENT